MIPQIIINLQRIAAFKMEYIIPAIYLLAIGGALFELWNFFKREEDDVTSSEEE